MAERTIDPEPSAREASPSDPPGPPAMDYRFRSGALELSGHLAEPEVPAHDAPGMVLCHGFPTRGRESPQSGKSFPELAEVETAMAGVATCVALATAERLTDIG